MNKYEIYQLPRTQGDQPSHAYFAESPMEVQPEWGASYEVVAAETTQENDPQWLSLRAKRNMLLSECDWTQIGDAQISSETKTAWGVYRQLLRDVPQQEGAPSTINWPVPPTE